MTDDRGGPSVEQLRRQWLAVLDLLERTNRTAWLALFDARLSHVEDATLWLDFADRDKFAGAHTFDVGERPDFTDALSDAVESVAGVRLHIAVKPSAGKSD